MRKKGTIAVIDDDITCLYHLGYWLKRNTDYYVYCFQSHAEFINSLHKDADIVITEMYFDGSYDSTKSLIDHVINYAIKTKVIVLSSAESMKDIIEVTGTDNKVIFIQKGIDSLEVLKETINLYTKYNIHGK